MQRNPYEGMLVTFRQINFQLKVNRGFGQGFPNWLKLLYTGQQGPSTLITKYCAYTSNRNRLVDHQKVIKLEHVQMPIFHFLFLLDLDPKLIKQISC